MNRPDLAGLGAHEIQQYPETYQIGRKTRVCVVLPEFPTWETVVTFVFLGELSCAGATPAADRLVGRAQCAHSIVCREEDDRRPAVGTAVFEKMRSMNSFDAA